MCRQIPAGTPGGTIMQTRFILLSATLLAISALLGWLATRRQALVLA
jgi:hypothetical protein